MKGYLALTAVLVFAVFAVAGGLAIGREWGRTEARSEAAFTVGGAASTILDAYYDEAELERAGILLKGNCGLCRIVASALNDEALSLDGAQLTELFSVLGCENVLVRAEAVVGGETIYRVTDLVCSVNHRVKGAS